ncbi:MAG TPA: Ig-like domain-containing protein, partial [Polyangiaceae bacterium LLY-WYZ-15_(1-7)]|nr:Ig-like domain-containing protein [Polyangiaceae bacterium LLY-WYZ-15_(1-7)]
MRRGIGSGAVWGALLTVALGVGCGDEGSGALAAPEVDAVDSPTNADPLTLEGSALAGATVEVRGGADAVASAVVDDTGRFAVDVALRADARQTLLISQRAGGEESPATELDVVHDGTAPEAPEVDPPATPTRRDALMLAGAAEAGATIEVRGGADEVATGGVDAEGRFELAVRLRTELAMLTQNELEVVAVDAAGNASAAAMVTVVHNPNLPLEAPTLDETPAATRERTLTLRGDTEPGAEVLVDGGAEATEGRADETGRFLVEVTLRPNTAHTLRVIARHPETGVASPAAMRSVVHDDIAPEPPNVDPLASPTGAESALAAGASEPG